MSIKNLAGTVASKPEQPRHPGYQHVVIGKEGPVAVRRPSFLFEAFGD